MSVALVTGCANGLGREIAKRLVADGHTVIGADIDSVGCGELERELGASFLGFELDVRSTEQWAALENLIRSRGDRLAVVVNNAGIIVPGTIESLELETFRNALEVDLLGPFHGCQLAIRLMREQGGAIINLGSRAGLRPSADLLAYNAAKAALSMLTKSVALHCGRSGYAIRCNAVHPGLIATKTNDSIAASLGAVDDVYKQWGAMIPLGRIGQADEVAGMISYLASAEASFVTGGDFTIDGGSSL